MVQEAEQAEVLKQDAVNKEGKYLTFALAHEEYGLEILKVREIIGYMEIAGSTAPAKVQGGQDSAEKSIPFGNGGDFEGFNS